MYKMRNCVKQNKYKQDLKVYLCDFSPSFEVAQKPWKSLKSKPNGASTYACSENVSHV